MSNMNQRMSGTPTGILELPTSDAQREILASVALGDDVTCAFNMTVKIEFNANLNEVALAAAVNDLGMRHQLLRSTYSEDGQKVYISPATEVQLETIDLQKVSSVNAADSIELLCAVEASKAMDLVREQPWRIKLVKMKSSSCLLITAHHVAVDGWSLTVMRDDLQKLYNAHAANTPADLEPAVEFTEYLDYLVEQDNNGTRTASRDFWIDKFSDGTPAFDFPLDKSRPAVRTYASKRCDVRVPQHVTDALRAMAREQGTSLFNVLFSVFNSYLYRASGAEEIVVGIPAAGHSVSGLYEMVGHCVNILPVRQPVSGDLRYDKLLSNTRSVMLDAQDHQEFTFSELLGQLDLERDASRIPVVSMLFNIDQDPGVHDFNGADGRAFTVPHAFENFEIFCNVLDRNGSLTIEWAYNTQLFSAESTEHRVHSFVAMLAQIANKPNIVLDDIGLFSAIDQEVYASVNSTALALPEPSTVLQMMDTALKASPEAEALVAGDVRLSYQELHQRSNQMAHYLKRQGVRKGDWVALCLERNESMVVAIIALMKLGATYVPLDPAYPADRVAYIIDNANASVILTQSNLLDDLPQHAGSNICLDTIVDACASMAITAPVGEGLSAEDLIYVIYTSGSTGNPKGVKLKHINVANFLATMAQTPGLVAADRLVAVTTLSFDIAVLELMLPLTQGACVVVATRDQCTDAEALQTLMAEERCTVLQATPATWRMLFQGGWKGQDNLKALVGGEALPRDLAMQLAACTHQLWNMYGPTETAIWSTCEQIVPDADAIYIGKPIGNTQVHILDERGHPAPVGQPGELLIGGDGVCAGYHQRDDLTRQVFIPDVFSETAGARLYRTRDRVKLHPDGRLEYLERMDNQVKVRGYRIELGEIETVLGQQDGVADCAVLAREDRPGDVRLVAYVYSAGAAVDDREIGLGLRQRLPEFMQPQHIVHMDEMPRTPNGKLDRKALPAPSEQSISAEKEILPARTETERWVAERWAELVGVEQVGIDDNFFAQGGHSLLAMRFIAESRKHYSGSLSLRMLLSDTLAQVAATLNPEDIVEQSAAASPAQQSNLAMYFAESEQGNMLCAYHAPTNGAAPKRAVLLVQSLGHEYQRGHRAMQELAVGLSKAGCAVLRFDYHNTGDSQGSPEHLKLAELQADLVSATDELVRLSGCTSVDVLSLRAGSLIVGSVKDSRWNTHFAWDPVTDGRVYHDGLKELHAKALRDWDRYIALRDASESQDNEYMGFEYPTDLMSALLAVKGDWLGKSQVIMSKGVDAPEAAEVVATMQVEPNWDDVHEAETHLQMPADVHKLVALITENAR